jgi:methionine synthase I (cobalamin-dependent)
LTEEAYQIAKTIAREQNRSLGSVVSDFITGRLGPAPAPEPDTSSGFPTFRCVRRVTSEDVKALDDEA